MWESQWTQDSPEIAVICIIDDDPWARSGLEELVLALGFPTRTFESAEQFAESDVISQTKCVITDVQMPGLSGLDLQKRLRTEGHKTPVILVTAYPSEAYRARALSEGAVALLTKPFDPTLMVDCIRRAMAA
jgi:FixJ family two-component response regulator